MQEESIEKIETTESPTEYYTRLIEESFPDGKVEEAKSFDIPSSFNYDNVAPEDLPLVEAATAEFTQYLEEPIISDSLTDHDERRILRDKLYSKIESERGKEAMEEFVDFYSHNKLKRNRAGRLESYVDLLDQYVPEEQITSLMTLIQENVHEKSERDEDGKVTSYEDPWDEAPLERKKEIVDEISNQVVQILQNFT